MLRARLHQTNNRRPYTPCKETIMRKQLVCTTILGLVIAAFAVREGSKRTEAAAEGGMLLAHDIYFKLKDDSAAGKRELVDACKKYLSGHPGEVFFFVGTRAE